MSKIKDTINKFKPSDQTKQMMKTVASISAKTFTPNTSKMVDDISKLKRNEFKIVNTKNLKSYDGRANDEYNKSYKQFINKSLNSVNKNEVEEQYKNSENDEEFFNDRNSFNNTDDEEFFNDNINENAGKTEPFFKESSTKSIPVGHKFTKNMKTITNNISISKNDRNTALTNKILLSNMKIQLESSKKSTSAILHNINILNDFNNTHTIAFFNDVSDKLAHIGNAVDNISSIYVDTEEIKMKQNRDYLIESIRNEGLSIAHLASTFMENRDDMMDIILSSVKDSNSSKAKKFKNKKIYKNIKNVKNIVRPDEDSEIKDTFFSKLYSSVKNFDDIIGSMPYNLQYALNGMKDGSKFKKNIFGKQIDFGKIAGKAFGMDTKVRKDIRSDKFTKGPIAYNGIANRAIVNVIPSLLSKILSAVTDNGDYKDELIYDYKKGKFTNKSVVRKERNQKVNDTVDSNLSGDIDAILGKNGSKKDKDLLRKAFKSMAEDGKTLSDYTGSITGNENIDKALREYYKNSKNKRSLNKNIFMTSMDMQKVFNDMGTDEAAQMAGDYDTNPYIKDRKRANSNIKYNKNEYFNRNEYLKRKQGKFTGKINDKLDSLFDKIEYDGKDKLKKTSDNSVYNSVDIRNAKVRNRRLKSNNLSNNQTIGFDNFFNTFKSLIDNSLNAINVTIKGGYLDSINNKVEVDSNESESRINENNNLNFEDIKNKVKEVGSSNTKNLKSSINGFKDYIKNKEKKKAKDEGKVNFILKDYVDNLNKDKRNESYKSEKERINNERKEDEGKVNFILKGANQRSKAQNKRIDEFKIRRDKLQEEMKDKVNDSVLGRTYNTIKEGVKTNLKNKVLNKTANSKLGQKIINSKIGKKFGLGDILKTPEAVKAAGMTPVYVMGSVGGISGFSGDNNIPLLETSKAKMSNLKQKALYAGGKLLQKTNVLGSKLKEKNGIAGKAGSLLMNVSSKGVNKISNKLNNSDVDINSVILERTNQRENLKDKAELARERIKDAWTNKGEAFKFAKEKATTLKKQALNLVSEEKREAIRTTATNILENIKKTIGIGTETEKGVMNISGEGIREGIRTASTTALEGIKTVIGTVASSASGAIEVVGSGVKALATAVSGIPIIGKVLAIGGVLGSIGIITALIASSKKKVEAAQNGSMSGGGNDKLDIGSLFSGGGDSDTEEKSEKEDKKEKKKKGGIGLTSALLTKKKENKSTAKVKENKDLTQGKLTIAEVKQKGNNIPSLLSNQYRLIY